MDRFRDQTMAFTASLFDSSISLTSSSSNGFPSVQPGRPVYRCIPVSAWRNGRANILPELGRFRVSGHSIEAVAINRNDVHRNRAKNGVRFEARADGCHGVSTSEHDAAHTSKHPTDFCRTEQQLRDEKEDSIIQMAEQGQSGPFRDGRDIMNVYLCFELPANTPLPNSLSIVYDGECGRAEGHATIRIRDRAELVMEVIDERVYGIHEELVTCGWRFHCFLFKAGAEVNDTIYRDNDVLRLLECVDMYMCKCDLEYDCLWSALHETRTQEDRS